MRDEAEVDTGRGNIQPLSLEAAAIDRLQTLNAKLFRAPDAIAVLTETMEAACTLLGADMGSAEIFHPERGELELVASRGFAGELPPGERIATPLLNRNGAVMAVISTYFHQPHLARDAELRILDLVVSQATYLIERFQAEEALRRSERLFAALFEQAACGIASVGVDERISLVNDRFCEILGRTREELLSKRIRDVTHPDDASPSVELFRAAQQDGRPYTMEKRYVRPDGSIVWATIDVSPLGDEHGANMATMGICQDVTQRKQVEEALRESDRRKDEFLATLAHELRNPLSPIVNGLELLAGQGRDPAFFDDIHGILTRQAQHMVRLVDDLLDVSRITRGKIELRRSRVNLATIVASAVETARPVIDKGRHALTLRLPEQPLLVDADPSRLSQVLSNLLNNAAKYMEAGGEIAVSAAREGDEAVLRVVDRGIGIPRQLLERIFDLFTQADPSMERSHSGLGIGLTIAKRLVEMHGGTIEARSAGANRGSEFVVRLPECTTEDLAHVGTADLEPAAVPRRVLVIDDNRSVLKSMCLLLERLGHEVRGASDGRTGVALGAELLPDVVLLDLAMPQFSGFETARLVREQPWGRDVVLVALTGWGQEEYRRRTTQAGFDHHFVKPIDGRQLQALLASLPARG